MNKQEKLEKLEYDYNKSFTLVFFATGVSLVLIMLTIITTSFINKIDVPIIVAINFLILTASIFYCMTHFLRKTIKYYNKLKKRYEEIKNNNLKKCTQEDIKKDFEISFIAGIGAGGTFWFFSYIIPFFLKREYLTFIIGFIIYIIIGVFLFLFFRYILIKKYGKK